jgi:hypothetical protein
MYNHLDPIEGVYKAVERFEVCAFVMWFCCGCHSNRFLGHRPLGGVSRWV